MNVPKRICDATGRHADGAVVGTVPWAMTGEGPSPSFSNTTTDYIRVASGPILGGNANFTVTARFTTGVSLLGNGISRPIYCERAASGNDILKLEAFVASQSDNSIELTYRVDSGTLIQYSSTKNINDGRVHTASATKNGDTFSLYSDGALDGSTSTSFPSVAFTDSGLECRLASDMGDGAAVWPTPIHFVFLHNRALTWGEIARLHADPYSLFSRRAAIPLLVPIWLSESTLSATLAGDTASGSATATTPPTSVASLAATPAISPSLTATATTPAAATATLSAITSITAVSWSATAASPPTTSASAAVTLASVIPVCTATATTPSTCTATLSLSMSGVSDASSAVASTPPAAVGSLAITTATTAAFAAVAGDAGINLSTLSATQDGVAAALSATAGLANAATADLVGSLASDVVAFPATFLQSPNAAAALAVALDGLGGPLAAVLPWRQPVRSKPASPRLARKHPLSRGLVAAWPYERGNSIIRDRVGSNPVTLVGTTAGNGPQGHLPAFASNASGATARAVGFERTQPFSVSLWAVLNQTTTRQIFLTNQAGGSAAQGWEVGYTIDAPAPNSKGIYLSLSNNKGAGKYLEQVGSIVPVPGRPYFFTWTYDGTSSVVGAKLYANGYLLPKGTPTANNLTASSLNAANLWWAEGRNADWYAYAGLGDVLIWNRDLSAVEVAQLAADPAGPLRPRWKRFFLGIPQVTVGTLTATVSGFDGYPASAATIPPASVAALGGPMFDLSAAGTAAATLPGIADATTAVALGGDSAAATAEVTPPPASTATLSAALADSTAAGTAEATIPPASTATLSSTLTGCSCTATATAAAPAPATASTSTTLGSDSASATAEATAPPASTATLDVTSAGTSAAATSIATTPAPATAATSAILAGDSAVFTAVRTLPPASTASTSATLAGDTATVAGTAVDPPGIFTARPGAPRLLRTHPRARSLVAAWCDPSGKLLLRDAAGGLNPIVLTSATQGSSPRGTLHVFSSSASGDASRVLELARTQPFSVALSVSFNATSSRQVLVTNQSVSGFYTGWEVGFAPNLPGLLPGFYLDLSNNKGSGSYLEQGALFSPTIDRVYRVAWTYDGSGLASGVRTYVDGLELARPVASRNALAGSTISALPPRLARDRMNANQFAGRLGDVLIWTRTLDRPEIEADARDPFAPVRPRGRRLWAGVASSGTGSVALSLGADAASATATATTPDPAAATLAATFADTTAAYAAVESLNSALAATLEDLAASGTAEADVPAAADAAFDVTLADSSAVALSNQAVASLVVATAGDTASFTSSGTIDSVATLAAQVNLGFNPLVGSSATASTATASVALADATPALTATRTIPPASSSSLSLTAGPIVAACTAIASPHATVSATLAGTSAAVAGLASTPPASAAALDASLSPMTAAMLASAAAPGSAIATTSKTLDAATVAATATAQSASVGSCVRALSGVVAATTATATAPAPASSSASVTLSAPVAAASATHTPPTNATASAAVTTASLVAVASATATTPAAADAAVSVSVGPATVAISAQALSISAAMAPVAEGITPDFSATATVPPASAAVGIVWMAGDASGLSSAAYPPSPIRSTFSLQLAGTVPRYSAATTIAAEIRGRLRLERAWQQIRRLLGTHTLTLERVPEEIVQGQHGGPETTWEPVPGFGAIEAIVTMTEATIEDSGMARQGRRRGKILTRTPLPTLGPNFRFLFNDPYSGTRYLNCTPERNLAQAGELWAVGVEEYP